MLQPVILIRPISLDLKKIWPVYLKLNLGLIWVVHVVGVYRQAYSGIPLAVEFVGRDRLL